MASRKEQKEKLRQERLKREQEAQAAEARKRMIGYGVAGALGVGLLVAIVLIATAGGGGGGKKSSGGSGDKVYPSGFDVPKQKVKDLKQAASAAQCQLKSFKSKGRTHVEGDVKYNSNPPTNGNHFPTPAEDGAYDKAPPITHLVHTLEHGRIIIWFRPGAPAKVRGTLKAIFDDDPYQMLLTPNNTKMPYEVAASAWGREPAPLGRGYLLACPKYNDAVPDAIRAFRDEHRGNGPEAIP